MILSVVILFFAIYARLLFMWMFLWIGDAAVANTPVSYLAQVFNTVGMGFTVLGSIMFIAMVITLIVGRNKI